MFRVVTEGISRTGSRTCSIAGVHSVQNLRSGLFLVSTGIAIWCKDLTQPVTMHLGCGSLSDRKWLANMRLPTRSLRLLTASENATCAFWDDGQWSSNGMSTLPAEAGFIKCSTVHFSFFAGVVDVFTLLGTVKTNEKSMI